MASVVVTGGAGFLGSHLVDQLREEHDVRVLDNLSTGSLRNLQMAADHPGRPANGHRLELMIGDIRDERLVRRAMRRADCVFHLAAMPASGVSMGNAREVHTVNVQSTLNVLQAATAEGVRRVVFASCSSVYGTLPGGPIGEEVSPQPVTVFAASKLAGEIYCRAYHAAGHLEAVILRYFLIYGPRENRVLPGAAMVPTLIDCLRRRRRPTIAGDGLAGYDLLYVEDAVAAALAAWRHPDAAGHVINVGSGQQASVVEVLGILNRLLRTTVLPRTTGPLPSPSSAGFACIGRARELLGFAPRVSLVSGLARAVEFYDQPDQPEDIALAEVGDREERP